MFRVREQLGFSDKLLAECGRDRITVAMLDTGVARHPDFDDRLLLFRDFVNGRKDLSVEAAGLLWEDTGGLLPDAD